MTVLEPFEMILRWFFSLQMLFWGLNGFFHLVQIPPTSEKMDRFVNVCIEVKFIMPTVKILEIILSLCLLANIFVPFSLIAFAPIIFIITGLHIFLNPRPFIVLLTCSLPYSLLLLNHGKDFQFLFHP